MQLIVCFLSTDATNVLGGFNTTMNAFMRLIEAFNVTTSPVDRMQQRALSALWHGVRDVMHERSREVHEGSRNHELREILRELAASNSTLEFLEGPIGALLFESDGIRVKLSFERSFHRNGEDLGFVGKISIKGESVLLLEKIAIIASDGRNEKSEWPVYFQIVYPSGELETMTKAEFELCMYVQKGECATV